MTEDRWGNDDINNRSVLPLLLLLFVVHSTSFFLIHKNSISTSGLITMPIPSSIQVNKSSGFVVLIVDLFFSFRNVLENQQHPYVHPSFHHRQRIPRLIEQYAIYVVISVEQNRFRSRKMDINFYDIYHLHPVHFQSINKHVVFEPVISAFYSWINNEN